jgi:protein involved in plasmid replication-relaxation
MSWQANQAHGSGPFGVPFGSSKKLPLTSINRDLVAPNDGAHTGTTPAKLRRKQRIKPRDVEELASWLSERDVAILRSVDEHQFLTVRQIEALHFGDHTPISGPRIARRTLARLRGFRLLATLKRRVGGVRAGSAGLVHHLDDVGNQLLHGGRTRRVYGPSTRFVNHRLAIADIHVALTEADRQGKLELVDCAAEPTSWRRYTGIGGARLTLKADLYVETATASSSDWVDAWYIEVDLGTETVPTLLKKCRDYEAYRRTGIEQEQGGFPLVIWCMTHGDLHTAQRRRLDLRKAIDGDRSLTPALFRIVSPDQLVPLLANGGAE